MNEAVERFRDSKYRNLETNRRNSKGVRTPLWFVEEDVVLHPETLSKTSRVKRLRREPHLWLVPCDRRGEPEG